MKRAGNPNWGKPYNSAISGGQPTLFDQMVSSLGLEPKDYQTSSALRRWADRNKNEHYIPPELLKAWGFFVDVRD